MPVADLRSDVGIGVVGYLVNRGAVPVEYFVIQIRIIRLPDDLAIGYLCCGIPLAGGIYADRAGCAAVVEEDLKVIGISPAPGHLSAGDLRQFIIGGVVSQVVGGAIPVVNLGVAAIAVLPDHRAVIDLRLGIRVAVIGDLGRR